MRGTDSACGPHIASFKHVYLLPLSINLINLRIIIHRHTFFCTTSIPPYVAFLFNFFLFLSLHIPIFFLLSLPPFIFSLTPPSLFPSPPSLYLYLSVTTVSLVGFSLPSLSSIDNRLHSRSLRR